MPVGYHHLTHVERCQIHARLYRGFSKREMARDLGRDPATISREASRHRGQCGDRHQQADGQATARRQAASAVPRKRTPERWAAVEDRLQAGGSPEQIAGRYRQQGEVMAGKEWIYQQVRADRQAGGTRYRCRRRRGTAALLRRLGPIRDRVHTGTADHGKEFARHREIAQKLDPGFYFSTPYHSWERGLNEHTNGLVRQYFPKGTDFR